MPRDKKMWFSIWGYGWMPKSWKGWLTVAIYIGLTAFDFVFINRSYNAVSSILMNFIPRFLILTAIFIAICYWKGGKPKWNIPRFAIIRGWQTRKG